MLKRFFRNDDGAVTVDWVVLTAFLCGLAIAVVTIISLGAREPTNSLNSMLATDIIGDSDSFD
jgi:Flp pilus assembly pilin Flp